MELDEPRLFLTTLASTTKDHLISARPAVRSTVSSEPDVVDTRNPTRGITSEKIVPC